MTLISASTLSVSEFAALVDAAAHDMSPLAPCPRSASPELRGSPLRRFSGAPSHPRHPRSRSQCASPPPPHFGVERCCGSPGLHMRHCSTRRGSASDESTYSSACSGEDDDDDDDDDDGIIWFGRRTPPCMYRTEQFRHWAEDAEAAMSRPPKDKTLQRRTATTTTTATTTAKDSRSAAALWSRLFVVWRARRARSRSSSPTARTSPSSLKKHPQHHRRMATSPS